MAAAMLRGLRRFDRVQQLVNEATLFAALHLQASLLADPQQGGIPDAFDLRLQRKNERRELGNGVDATLHQRLPLVSRDSGDQRQVVVIPPAFVAEWEPRANIAVLSGFGVRL